MLADRGLLLAEKRTLGNRHQRPYRSYCILYKRFLVEKAARAMFNDHKQSCSQRELSEFRLWGRSLLCGREERGGVQGTSESAVSQRRHGQPWCRLFSQSGVRTPLYSRTGPAQ